MKLIAPALVAALVLTGCAATTIETNWKKPGAAPPPMNKVVIFAAVKDQATRRTIEDLMVSQLAGSATATQSYLLVPNNSSREDLRAQMLQGGFDTTIVMRLLNVEQRQEWVPGAWAGPYYDFGFYDSGHLESNTYVRVETNVYALPSEELIWAATSETVNPANVNGLIKSTVKVVTREMTRQGLLVQKVALADER